MKKLSVLISFIVVLSLSLSAEKLSDLKSGKHVLYVEEQEGHVSDDEDYALVVLETDTVYGLNFINCESKETLGSTKTHKLYFKGGTDEICLKAIGYGEIKAGLSESLIAGRAYKADLTGSGAVEIILKEKDIYGDKISFNMKLVEGGVFCMGSTDKEIKCYKNDGLGDDYEDEKVRMNNNANTKMGESDSVSVELSTYYIGETEVTVGVWKHIMNNNLPNGNDENDINCPVVNLTWSEASEFTQKLSEETGMTFRLPTEAEWEYAARGGKWGKRYRYAGSNNLDDVAWSGENSGRTIHPVGKKQPNELGLYDMSGNAYEFCIDHKVDYKSGDYAKQNAIHNGIVKNPIFIKLEKNKMIVDCKANRVKRGGSCAHGKNQSRVAYRRRYDVEKGDGDKNGLRLVLEAEPNEKLRSILGNND